MFLLARECRSRRIHAQHKTSGVGLEIPASRRRSKFLVLIAVLRCFGPATLLATPSNRHASDASQLFAESSNIVIFFATYFSLRFQSSKAFPTVDRSCCILSLVRPVTHATINQHWCVEDVTDRGHVEAQLFRKTRRAWKDCPVFLCPASTGTTEPGQKCPRMHALSGIVCYRQ